jgi:DNA-binding IclR family transcriptional regulator
VGELVEQGLLERLPNAHYRIGLHLWELAVRTPGAVGIRELALPHLQVALQRIGQHVQLAVLQDGEILSLERLSSANAVINLTVVGGRMPFYATSSGLVLAANAPQVTQDVLIAEPRKPHRYAPQMTDAELRSRLELVRRDGFATTAGYIDPAATAIAVPVIGPVGNVIATVASVVPSADPHEQAVLEVLSATATGITTSLTRTYSGS